MKHEFRFTFGSYASRVILQHELPSIEELIHESGAKKPVLLVCDSNTENYARKILGKNTDISEFPLLILPDGERSKTWESVEAILRSAKAAGLGRDGLFVGIGGGVIGDLTGFAASIFMRGAQLCLVSTTLLGMSDASIGGKTGINLLGLKNLAGSFFPACLVYMPYMTLDTLPEREWKSGIAELIKTAILDSEIFFNLIGKLLERWKTDRNSSLFRECLMECIYRSVTYKGKIVEADPGETGNQRSLLNLGHTFGHALETATDLNSMSHGEAVAWGIARACDLGLALGITSQNRSTEIIGLLKQFGYETSASHPLVKSTGTLINSMMGDKKQKAGSFQFIVPNTESAQIVSIQKDSVGIDLLYRIIDSYSQGSV